jgi:hypothetical protein
VLSYDVADGVRSFPVAAEVGNSQTEDQLNQRTCYYVVARRRPPWGTGGRSD